MPSKRKGLFSRGLRSRMKVGSKLIKKKQMINLEIWGAPERVHEGGGTQCVWGW